MADGDVTQLLRKAAHGDEAAQNELAAVVYRDLKRIAESHMRRERDAHSVQATLLVNDAFMRLVQQADVEWETRSHFFALASRTMRQILVDHARARQGLKRGGGVRNVELDDSLTVSATDDDDVLRVDEALRVLAEIDPRQAEMVNMRFFGGMSMDDVAGALGMPKRTAEREWTLIKAWLRRELAST